MADDEKPTLPNPAEWHKEQTDEERVALFERVRLVASLPENLPRRCLHGEVVVYVPFTRGVTPGHIYSPEGYKEFNISGCCEYHFDLMFKED